MTDKTTNSCLWCGSKCCTLWIVNCYNTQSKDVATHYDLNNPLWLSSFNNTCNCCSSFNTKTFARIRCTHDHRGYWNIIRCWWLYYSVSQKKASTSFNTIQIVAFQLQIMNWSQALGRFLGRITNLCRAIHVCWHGIHLLGIKCMILIWLHPFVIHKTPLFLVNSIDPFVTLTM